MHHKERHMMAIQIKDISVLATRNGPCVQTLMQPTEMVA